MPQVMAITDAMIQQSIMKSAIGSIIAGVVFIIAGSIFGYFLEKERRQVIDEKDRKLRLMFHSVTAVLILTGLFFVGWLGGRWLISSTSYVVYETTVADKKENRIRRGNSENDHISYQVYFEGTYTSQQLSSAQKDKYDSINIGDRVLIVDGIRNSYLKVYYDSGYTYEGSHMIDVNTDNVVGTTQKPAYEYSAKDTTESERETMKFYINDNEIPVKWENNASVNEIAEEASKNEIIVEMSMYSNNEQVGSLGKNYSSNDKQTTTHNGDIVLYNSSNIVVFYGSNSWAYTRLGKMELSEEEVAKMLSNGNVTIRITN